MMKGSPRTCGCHSHNGMLLSPEGLAQRDRKVPGLDAMALSSYVDSKVSVSGLRRDETLFDDALLEQQYRRFLND